MATPSSCHVDDVDAPAPAGGYDGPIGSPKREEERLQ